jgi:hypothetical protein
MFSTKNVNQFKLTTNSSLSIFTAFLCLFYVLTFSSCKTELDEVIGTWDLVEWNVTGCPDSSDNFNLAFGSNGCLGSGSNEICTNITQVFTEAGTYRASGTITLDGDVLISQNNSGMWERVGGALQLCDSDGDCNEDTTVSIVGNRATVSTSLQGCTSVAIYEKAI